jgi:type IV pilus assembly protein PilA
MARQICTEYVDPIHQATFSMTAARLRPQLQASLMRQLTKPSSHKKDLLQQGFTLVELMIVIVSAVAIPQFMKQTKKAVATEAVTQVSAITKQAATVQLEEPITAVNVSADCSAYSGSITSPKFNYTCDGPANAFVVEATGKASTNAEGITVKQTSDLETGAVGKPEVTGT